MPDGYSPLENGHGIWTDAQRTVLTKLWADGLTARAIGAEMGKSRNSIIGQAHRLNLPKRVPGNTGTSRTHTKRGKRHRNYDPIAAARYREKLRAQRMSQPVVKIAPEPLPPDCEPISLMDSKPGLCRYPVKEWAAPNSPFMCGGNTDDIAIGYCRFHLALCYQPGRTWTNKSVGSLTKWARRAYG